MARRKMLAAGSLLAAAILLGLVAWLFRPQPPLPSWTMPDGTTMRVVKVSYGTNHVYNYGHRLVDLLYPLVPAAYRSKFYFQVKWIPMASPGVVLWVEREETPASKAAAANSGSSAGGFAFAGGPAVRVGPPVFFVNAVDGAGVQSRPSISATRGGANGLLVYAAEVPEYPRRSPAITIRIRASFSPESPPVTEFKIPNPRPQNAPDWSAEPLPATRRTNGLEVTLLRVGGFPRQGLFSPRQNPPPEGSVMAGLEVKEDGRPSTNWGITGIILSDAVGEVHHAFNGPINPIGSTGSSEVTLSGPFWTEERAWKMQVEVSRIAGFAAEDTWKIPAFSLPGQAPGTGGHNWTNQLRGGDLIIGTDGPGVLGPAFPAAYHFPRFALQFYTPTNCWVTLIKAQDERGRDIAQQCEGASVTLPVQMLLPERRLQIFDCEAPAGATTANLVLGLSRTLTIEFMVRAPTNANSLFQPAR